MQQLIFTNSKGQIIKFYNRAPWLFTSISGISESKTEFQTIRGYQQDGVTLEDVYCMERAITLKGTLKASSRIELYSLRKQLTNILSAKNGLGEIHYINDYGQYMIKGVVENAPDFKERFQNTAEFLITFYCPSPFFTDVFDTTVLIRYNQGGFRFPLRFPTSFAEASFKKVINNIGDVPAPLTFEYFGPAVNPIIYNNTSGEFIKVNKTLQPAEKLIITTGYDNVSVTLVKEDMSEENVFQWIDIESTFFELQEGENELQYASDDNSSLAKVMVHFRNLYVGV